MLQPCSTSSTPASRAARDGSAAAPLRPKSKTVGTSGSAEVPRPEVIDRDAGRERIALVGDPPRQGGPSAGAGRRESLRARRFGFQVRFGRLAAPRRGVNFSPGCRSPCGPLQGARSRPPASSRPRACWLPGRAHSRRGRPRLRPREVRASAFAAGGCQAFVLRDSSPRHGPRATTDFSSASASRDLLLG